MFVLNLDNDFKYKSNGLELEYKYFVFAGGEPSIKIKMPHDAELHHSVTINIKIKSFNDIGKLVIAVDALKRLGIKKINLFSPYFPGARQDRVMVKGESLTCKVYTDIINSLCFDEVIIYDSHSDVVPALLNNCINHSNAVFVVNALKKIINVGDDFMLISPDAGANKKIKDLAKQLIEHGHKPYIVKCDKTRDVATGKISGFEVYDTLIDAPGIIVDDICDGGGTFLGLGKELKNKFVDELHLITTHGIYSRGIDDLLNMFKTISCTNSFVDTTYNDNINIYKI
jgi:ribose-phosphate pyrophosphokinase